jgi:hypothetical protein
MNKLKEETLTLICEVLEPREVLLKDGDDLFKSEGNTELVDSYRKGKDSAVVIYSLSQKYLVVELDISEDKVITELERVIGEQISFMVITSDSKVCVWVKDFQSRSIIYRTLKMFYRPAFS